MSKNSVIKKITRKILVFILLISLWQIACVIIKNDLLIASPIDVAIKLSSLIIEFSFWKIILGSIIRILIGFALGIVIGTITSFAMLRINFLGELISPIITIVQAVPVTAFITLALIWINEECFPVLIVFLIVFPLCVRNIMSGVQNMPLKKICINKCIKQVKPYLLTTCRSGIAFSFKAGIAAEIISKTYPSIGGSISLAKDHGNIIDLFVWITIVIITSILFDLIIVKLFSFKLHKA